MKIFVYGSLKRGQFNHQRYGFGEIAEYVGEAVADNIQLVELGGVSFPHAVAVPDAIAEGELYNLNLETAEGVEVLLALHQMELSAGYSPRFINVATEEDTYTALAFVVAAWAWEHLRQQPYKEILSWNPQG